MTEAVTSMEPESPAVSAAGPPKWFHFRWRVLLIVPAALIVLALVFVPRQIAQRQAIAELEKLGATIRTQPLALPGARELFGEANTQEVIEIYWRNPQLNEDDLKVVQKLPTLQKLELAGSRVTSSALGSLSGLAHLYILHLADTPVTDDGLAHLAPLKSLSVLSLSNTTVGDAGVAELAGLRQLERLYLNGTKITDAGLAHVAKLTGLKELSLERTSVTDAGMVHLRSLSNLEFLRVHGTQVTLNAIKELHAALPKTVVASPTE